MGGRSDSALLLPKGRAPRRVKPARYENKGHLSFIRDWSCALAGWDCEGPVEAHHLLKPWSGSRGMGKKAGDENTIGLCACHHAELHRRGSEDDFWREKTGDPDFGRTWARKLWEDSPYHDPGVSND